MVRSRLSPIVSPSGVDDVPGAYDGSRACPPPSGSESRIVIGNLRSPESCQYLAAPAMQ